MDGFGSKPRKSGKYQPSLKSRLVKETMKSVKPIITNIAISKQRKGVGLLRHFCSVPKDVHIKDAESCFGAKLPMHAVWLIPDQLQKGKVILYAHGGSYVYGSPETHKSIPARLASMSGYAALSYDYRLAPEFPFPAALDDAVAAFDYLLDQGYSEDDIVVCGDSAGGGLSIALVMTLRDRGRKLPAGIIVISPWTDLTHSGKSHISKRDIDPLMATKELRKAAELYAGGGALSNRYISPLFGDFKDFPPTLIHVGSNEILLDDSKRLAARMVKQKVDVRITIFKDMWHVFHMFDVPESYTAIRRMAQFLDSLWQEDRIEYEVHPGAYYRHYKGNEYRVLHIARHSETLEELVVYQQLHGNHNIWVCQLDMFLETVECNGTRVYRFEEIKEG